MTAVSCPHAFHSRARDVAFCIFTADELPETVIAEAGDASGAVRPLCQKPLAVPFQTDHAAGCIGNGRGQRFPHRPDTHTSWCFRDIRFG